MQETVRGIPSFHWGIRRSTNAAAQRSVALRQFAEARLGNPKDALLPQQCNSGDIHIMDKY
jgi:hypothetical protein